VTGETRWKTNQRGRQTNVEEGKLKERTDEKSKKSYEDMTAKYQVKRHRNADKPRKMVLRTNT
jgi:hypothetical protein